MEYQFKKFKIVDTSDIKLNYFFLFKSKYMFFSWEMANVKK